MGLQNCSKRVRHVEPLKLCTPQGSVEEVKQHLNPYPKHVSRVA